MNEFHNELQMLNVGDFNTSEAVHWDPNGSFQIKLKLRSSVLSVALAVVLAVLVALTALIVLIVLIVSVALIVFVAVVAAAVVVVVGPLPRLIFLDF